MRIYIIAGEPSGDLLGARLLPYLERHTLKGIGGDMMQRQGFHSLFSQEKISVMGIFEILPSLPCIYKCFRQTIKDIHLFKPDIILTIDSPGFCKRIIQKLRKQQFQSTFIHYVAPSVWAWRESRAKKWAELVDHMLCLFPFEPAYFEKYGLKSTFVGHPVTEWLLPKLLKDNQLIVLPGSRVREIKQHAKIFGEAARIYQEKHPHVKIVWVTRPSLKALLQKIVPWAIIDDDAQKKDQLFAASSLAIAASGTVTLELSYANVPMVMGYKISWFTEKCIKHLIKIPHACLVNILHNKAIVPEFLQKQCTAENLAKGLETLKEQPFPSCLMGKTASQKVAQILLENTTASC